MKWLFEIVVILVVVAAAGSAYIGLTGKLEFTTNAVEVKKLNRDNAACGVPANPPKPLPVEAPDGGAGGGEAEDGEAEDGEAEDGEAEDGGTTGDTAGASPPDPNGEKIPVPVEDDKIEHIGLADAEAAWQDGLIFVDARASKYFAEGHIPGARSIPAHEPGKEDKIQAIADEVGLGTPIVIYCNESSECEDSHIVGEIMRDGFGFVAIQVYEGGFPGWVKAKKPYCVGEDPGDVSTAIQPTDERYGKSGDDS